MKNFNALLAALAFGSASCFALAQGTAGNPPAEKGPKDDCGAIKAPAMKARCEAKQKAVDKCQALKGEQKGKCMRDAADKN